MDKTIVNNTSTSNYTDWLKKDDKRRTLQKNFDFLPPKLESKELNESKNLKEANVCPQ